MKSKIKFIITAITITIILSFLGLYTLRNDKLERDNKNRIDREAEIADSISMRKHTLEANACYVCKKQIGAKSYSIENDGTYKEYNVINGSHAMFCSIKCCEAEDKRTYIDNDDINTYSNNQNSSDYEMGDDGKVYETNPCSMCKGAGVTKGRNIISGEIEYLTCQMCEGQGVRSY
jgi:hypothetical protein